MGKKSKKAKSAGLGGELAADAHEEAAREAAWSLNGDKKKKKNKAANGNGASKPKYVDELVRLQFELIKLQDWVQKEGLKVCVIFEGRDAAGKGGVIKRITESLNPRVCKVVALGTPTERERSQWYFQRYVPHLPGKGEMVLFDRSWYNRAGVERVMKFCSDEEYEEFLRACPLFEEMLIKSGTILIKYWFSVSDEEQERRFKERIENPIKRWKLSPMDLQSREHWVEYSQAKDVMQKHTDTDLSPWNIVDANNKKKARINCMSHLLSRIPYKEIPRAEIKLSPRQQDGNYVRPPKESQRWVPAVY
ncbi:polyphosphate kinase 2 [Pararhizobium sp.]|uniref:polyphosphate kinase 2 n=1 Tax=Pararhizobium sp. TaxID=1977563 RepID=UPI00271FD8AA|nr:polyphosphate kinase 2 [Pararhizobium sp.]MDO9417281.1 polyphosphate kinase 2 [Pararhizobium sp.]